MGNEQLSTWFKQHDLKQIVMKAQEQLNQKTSAKKAQSTSNK